ncbi:MAG: hypothetical protein OHK93_000051 [Ramalina farinacea]|uniref:Nephrocystin 3-like N-terminal domain-containing protein n=1 Tax=Ramalina farinacea TaxID=258253 RepID=A0AA43QE43_9LECA|nr:hypothetical protein [Ramalina farinacea]
MIGEAMPRFDKFSTAFAEDPDFQQILGLFYADILEFHRRAYKFFRRRCRSLFFESASLYLIPLTKAVVAWTIIFESLWRTFKSRFDTILESLMRHRDLIDREAAAIDITQGKEWRAQQMRDIRQWRAERAEYIDKLEKDLLATQLREAVAWLGARDDQDNEFSRVSDACSSKHWALEDPKLLSWLDQSRYNSVLWLNGKPGAGKPTMGCDNVVLVLTQHLGKSVICSKIIEHLHSSDATKIIYYFCRHNRETQYPATDILKEFATQLLAANRELAPYILDTFANNGLKPAKRHLTVIVERLIAALPSVRMIVDGLDELSSNAQEEVMKDLLKLKGSSVGAYKLLFSSQCIPTITKKLRDKPQLRLEDCSESIDATIAIFVKPKMDDLRQRFDLDPSIVDGLESKILQKAQG